MSLTLRRNLDRPLTTEEMDNNFLYLAGITGSTSGGGISADNGLTLSGQTVLLGGSLVQDTTLNLSDHLLYASNGIGAGIKFFPSGNLGVRAGDAQSDNGYSLNIYDSDDSGFLTAGNLSIDSNGYPYTYYTPPVGDNTYLIPNTSWVTGAIRTTYSPWVSGYSLKAGGLVSYDSPPGSYSNFYVLQNVSGGTSLAPTVKISGISNLNTQSDNITAASAWLTNAGIFSPMGEVYLQQDLQISSHNGDTFPFFSLQFSLEPQKVSFTIVSEAVNYESWEAEYEFIGDRNLTPGQWIEVLPKYSSSQTYDGYTHGGTFQIHVDVYYVNQSSFEFRLRTTTSNSGSNSTLELFSEFRRSGQGYYYDYPAKISNYWVDLVNNPSVDPNLTIPGWLGNDVTAISPIPGKIWQIGNNLIDDTGATFSKATDLGNYLSLSGSNQTVSQTPTFASGLSVSNAPVQLAAGTTSHGSLIVPAGSSYGATSDGTVWQDGTNLYGIFGGSMKLLSETILDITYANLVAGMSASSLIKGVNYRITDYQTVHNIPYTSPTAVNTGPVEPLIVRALTSNTISSHAFSEQYPQDEIEYSISNSIVSGSTKGCILYRYDRAQNVRVSSDFRNVKYRRWKLNPAAFNGSSAYSQYQTVQGADGALYYCATPGGMTAGSATTPSTTDDNWVQVCPNNNYYYARSTSNGTVYITSNSSPTHTNPAFPVDSSNYVDTVMFPNYGTGFSNIDLYNGKGNLMNLVIWNDNQTTIVDGLKIGENENPVTGYNSTIVVTGSSATIRNMTFPSGMAYSWVTTTGTIRDWNSPKNMYSATINCSSFISECSFTPFYSVVRGNLYQVIGQRLEYTVTPSNFSTIIFPMGMGNLKFNTNANALGWNVLNGLGSATTGNPFGSFVIQSSTPDVVVDTAMSWRTFIGSPDITSSSTHGSSTDLATQIAMAKTKLIVYDYEEPTGKSIIDIANGATFSVSWQSDKPSVNLSSPSGYANDSKAVRTYFVKHGNDFQVQQKDLISGTWTPNNSPTWTINSLDGNGNITSVSFVPNPGASESRFIIV